VDVPSLYAVDGPSRANHGWSTAGTAAWIGGAVVFYATQRIGASLPTLAASILIYVVLARGFQEFEER
jgi:hypothetical protein